jgi:hypothetical protein
MSRLKELIKPIYKNREWTLIIVYTLIILAIPPFAFVIKISLALACLCLLYKLPDKALLVFAFFYLVVNTAIAREFSLSSEVAFNAFVILLLYVLIGLTHQLREDIAARTRRLLEP